MIMGQVTFVFSPKVMLLYVVLAWKCYRPICTWMSWTVWVRVALALRCALHSAAQEQEAAIHELKENTALVPGRDSERTRSEMSSANSFKFAFRNPHLSVPDSAAPLPPPGSGGAGRAAQAPGATQRCSMPASQPPGASPSQRPLAVPLGSRERGGGPAALPGRTSAARRVLGSAARGCVATLLRPRLSNTWAWLWKRRSINKRS